jgi:glycosyltransferase involved in cell wall biosynthesis
MKIGIDARNLVPKLSGIGRYVAETSRHLVELGHEVFAYLPSPPHSIEAIAQGVHPHISHHNGALARIWWGNTSLLKLAKRDQVDLLWGPAHRLPVLGSSSIPTVLTIHDLVWRHASDTMRPLGWLGERVFMERSIRSADHVVAVSSATETAVSATYPWAREKISVVYPGCTPLAEVYDEGVINRAEITRPFVLFVGTLEPRKNLSALLRAFAALPDHLKSGLQLVIAGGQGWGLENLQTEISRLSITDLVRLTGFISDAELGTLYRKAKFLAMPSLYEGFGLPIIEANAAGIPVLTSSSSSMPEVGGDAALLVDPLDDKSIAKGLERLITDEGLYQRLREAATANAARFNWTRTATELAVIFEQTVGLSKAR